MGGTDVLASGVAIGALGALESGGASYGVALLFGEASMSVYGIAGNLDMLGAYLQSQGTGDNSYSNDAASYYEAEEQNDVNAGPFLAPVESATQTIEDGVSDAYGEGPPMANCH
jgi:hypothetical protein